MPKPIICFDMDGTLVNERGEIHPADVEILSSLEPPALFIPSTGRLLPAVRRVLSRHHLFDDIPLPMPLVLQNGAALYAPGEELLRAQYFSDSLQEFLLDLAQHESSAGVTYLFFSVDHVYVSGLSDFAQTLLDRFDLQVEPWQPERPVQLTKLMALSEDHSRLEQVHKLAERSDLEQSFSLPTALEITPAGIDKGSGLQWLLAQLKEDGGPIFAAGDGGNDLSLFRLASHSFAPLSATATVKLAASALINVPKTGLLKPILDFANRLAT